MVDRLLIRERMSDYADSMMRQDKQAWLDNFTTDCIWRGVGLEYRGHEELAMSWDLLWGTLKSLGFFTEASAIRLERDHATARCYSRQIMFQRDGGVRKIVGVYNDVLLKRADTWRFHRREFAFVGEEPAAASVNTSPFGSIVADANAS